MKPTLSVLLANYNHGNYIAQAIEAVVSQSRPPDEYIIVDDGSTDNSVEIIERYARRHPFIQVIKHKRNLGLHAAVQRANTCVSSQYLIWTAADDYLCPVFFEKAMAMAEQHPQAGVLFGGQTYLRDGLVVDLPEGFFRWREWKSSFFMPPLDFLRLYVDSEHPTHALSAATILRTATLAEIGGWRPELGFWADVFTIRAAGLRHGACFVEGPGAVFRLSANSYANKCLRDPKLMLDIMARAAWLMRSPAFKDIFPETHVQRWEKTWREFVIHYNCHDVVGAAYLRAGEAYLRALTLDHLGWWYVGRGLLKATGMFRRLQILWLKWALERYTGDVSCYGQPGQ